MKYFILIEQGEAYVGFPLDGFSINIPERVILLKLDPAVNAFRRLICNIIVYGLDRGTLESGGRDAVERRCAARTLREWLRTLPPENRSAAVAYLHHSIQMIRATVKRPDFPMN